jgi:hypothetical protein
MRTFPPVDDEAQVRVVRMRRLTFYRAPDQLLARPRIPEHDDGLFTAQPVLTRMRTFGACSMGTGGVSMLMAIAVP